MVARILSLLLFCTPLIGQDIRAQGQITVERIIIDAHVIDDRGNPLEDLRPSDFKVLIDGEPAQIESVEWIPADQERIEVPAGEGEMEEPAPPGRLLVFFFQTDFGRATARVKGQMRMIAHANDFLETLLPTDRVAVVQFDSHLKVRQDFTDDREKLRDAITNSLLISKVGVPERVPLPSLMSRLNIEDARRAASPEKALFLLGNALLPIPGPKSMVMFGWGLGRFSSGGVTMTRDYSLARRALEQSRTAVFSMDICDCDYHSLEVGQQKVAADTGGFYAKTHLFPTLAMKKLERTLSGHYELVVKKSSKVRGVHDVSVSLVRRRGTVLSRSTYED